MGYLINNSLFQFSESIAQHLVNIPDLVVYLLSFEIIEYSYHTLYCIEVQNKFAVFFGKILPQVSTSSEF